MPQPSFHLQLSREVLEAWSETPGTSPFKISEPTNRAAFLHGSLGPDMGYFPGCPRELAQVAHQGPTGDFVRELLCRAVDERACAFAFGWASHLLLDALLHPWINATAASLLDLSLEDATWSQLEHTHIRLEIGLDLTVHRRAPGLHTLRLDPLFEADSLGFLARTFRQVHAVPVAAAELASAHRKVSQILGPMLRLQASMAYARVDGAHGPSTAAVWGVRAGLNTLQALATCVKGLESATAAFLTPLQTDALLLQRVDAAVARFRAEFQSHVQSGLATLPNYNVENGTIELAPFGESAA